MSNRRWNTQNIPAKMKVGRKKFLSGGQAKLDANKDGKITGEDFKMLRSKNKNKKMMAKKKSPRAKAMGIA